MYTIIHSCNTIQPLIYNPQVYIYGKTHSVTGVYTILTVAALADNTPRTHTSLNMAYTVCLESVATWQ